jgi:exonuclease SbcC
MSEILLHNLEVSNFRSIRGTVQTPLDAQVVLVHGENGAGKTSLLSSIELALTGRVMALQRADPSYRSQLLHRGAELGEIDLRTTGIVGNNQFQTALSAGTLESKAVLDSGQASFFTERCYLPQALLGQLLQIYQDSDSSVDSPLSRFVNELLGLDRLDAIETGLAPVADLRNLRKTTDRFSQVELEKQRLERSIAEHQKVRAAAQQAVTEALAEINAAWSTLGFTDPVKESDLGNLDDRLAGTSEEVDLARLIDQRRNLESIGRNAAQMVAGTDEQAESALAALHNDAAAALQKWLSQNESALTKLRERVARLLPNMISGPSDLQAWHQEASAALGEKLRQSKEQAERASKDNQRTAELKSELNVARKNFATMEAEIKQIGEDAGSLSAALAEIAAFVSDQTCPVCDRDFGEVERGALADHVNHKVRTLSGSAERLLGLSRNRSTQQGHIDRLVREEASIAARTLDSNAIAVVERQIAELESAVAELGRLAEPIDAHAALAAAEATARRALSEHQTRTLSRGSSLSMLADIAGTLGQATPDPLRPIQDVVTELIAIVDKSSGVLNIRVLAKRKIGDAGGQANLALGRRGESDRLISDDSAKKRRADAALNRAARIRTDAQAIKGQVEAVRAKIIGREFNDRLNRLWRDLFVRLAPNEPFVPAFKIPTNSTHRLQPKLITSHRSGGSGGTPGAMLSAGNLNTAALTLFIALHLTVAPQLPWLILDDPVQSMDDVHVAHFAALLRTLSKGQHRQVIVAVHDRQLFEYLRLELSPAFQDDSLLTVELSRSATRDTNLFHKRLTYQAETVLRQAA